MLIVSRRIRRRLECVMAVVVMVMVVGKYAVMAGDKRLRAF